MTKTSKNPDLEKWTLQFQLENENALADLLAKFRNKIDKDEMPKPIELLRDQDPDEKIKRPPNSNIIYTNQLGKFGLLALVRNFCEKNNINKQRLVPISKKASNFLWERLSEDHKKFFDQLALKVAEEHKKLYPNYKYNPVRKPKKEITYKPYHHTQPKTPKTPKIPKITPPTTPPFNHVEFPQLQITHGYENLSSSSSTQLKPNKARQTTPPTTPPSANYAEFQQVGPSITHVYENLSSSPSREDIQLKPNKTSPTTPPYAESQPVDPSIIIEPYEYLSSNSTSSSSSNDFTFPTFHEYSIPQSCFDTSYTSFSYDSNNFPSF